MTDNLLTADIPTTLDDIPQNIPPKFWDTEKKEIRSDALLASYLALEKKLSQSFAVPETEADKLKLHRLLGCPETADGYNVSMTSDVLSIDPDMHTRLHNKGFTNEQVQEVYDLAIERLVPLILEMSAEFQAEREVERLVEYFGSIERWQETARQLNEYGRKNLPPLAFDGLNCSYDGVMALYQMMKGNKGLPSAKEQAIAADSFDEKGLKTLMQNPKYWREKDPSFIAKVTAGFEKLYGGE